MPYIVILEGQETPISDEVGATDQTLRDALTPFYPEVSTAEIKREEKDGNTYIRIVKRAGTKGQGNIMQIFIQSEQTINPAITLTLQLKILELQGEMHIENLLLLQSQINKAISSGREWNTAVERSLKILKQSPPKPSQTPITGF
ncbi:hypothetical protein G7B40_025200 [Aetokthonos hydrillicola Thurmond2011]|jgi:hypothetical protein|uniref:Uncharacterized protein n=1 Tax=Aetokthonos hydrillicola Thurmond2011 TaxID=2712845 RepID=A0AAP5IAB3_9CYAN|nr:hypothetical protein [Aetokthonos hydrillicola]MBO3458445.1 hypothetical protein [Aetokthonos hydrillicola CCALA 1050]MBW4586228.1 hypothetical protein [Aetokthonos hydrillicola CCALA 1050]MDR9897835.1 hypothetical protein [Aetokthonos hydrillicola Thurmond2011]